MYDRKSLKQRARVSMAQAQPKTWVVTLALLALVALLPMLLQQLIPGGREALKLLVEIAERPERGERLAMRMMGILATYASLSLILGVVFALFRVVLGYGYRGYALRVYRGEKVGVGALFGGFSRLGTVLGSGIMVWVFVWLWMMLMTLVSSIVGGVIGLLEGYLPAPVRVLALTALVIVDVLWGLWIIYRYALTPYFVMSRPDMGAFDAIKASKQAMKGNKVRRVVLELSFLGWRLLLGLIAAVVGAVGSLLAVLAVSDSLFRLAEMLDGGVARPERVLSLLGEMILPYTLVGVVTVLVCLPLKLWLMSYENVAYAGFFQEIVGGAPAMAETVTPPVVGGVPVTAGESGERPYDPFGGAAAPAPQPPRQEERPIP